MTATMADAAPGSASGPGLGTGEPAPLAPPLWGDTHPWFLDDPARPCFTCGATPTHRFHDGSPAYSCGPHPPIRHDPAWQPATDPIRLGITLGQGSLNRAEACAQRLQRERASKGLSDTWGAKALDADGRLTNDLLGAEGELAFAKLAGLPWRCATGYGKPDVGRYQVRTVSRADYALIVHEKDSGPVVLMVRERHATYRLLGWLPDATKGKRPEWVKDPDARRPAWFVPQAALHDPRTLPELAQGA